MNKLSLLIFAFIINALPLFGQFGKDIYYLSYHPALEGPLEIGRGFDPLKATKMLTDSPFARIIVVPDTIQVQGQVLFHLIESHKDFLDAFKLDASLDAKYPTWSANGALSITKKEIQNSDNLTMVFTATTDYGVDRLEINPPRSERVKRLLDKHQYDSLYRSYGDFIVTGRKRTKSAYVSITINNFYKKYASTFDASLKAQYGSSGNSVSLDVKVRKILNKSFSEKEFKIRAFTVGKFEIKKDEDIVSQVTKAFAKNKDFVSSVDSVLTDYLRSMNNRDSSSISGFFFTDWEALGVASSKLRIKPSKVKNYDVLSNRSKLMNDYNMLLEEISVDPNYRNLRSDFAFDIYTKERNKLYRVKDYYDKIINQCLNDTTCEDNCCTIPADAPEYKEDSLNLLTSIISDPLGDFNFIKNEGIANTWTSNTISIYKSTNRRSQYFKIPEYYKLSLDFGFKFLVGGSDNRQRFQVQIYINDRSPVLYYVYVEPNHNNAVLQGAPIIDLDEIGGAVNKVEIKVQKAPTKYAGGGMNSITWVPGSFINLKYIK